MGREGSKERERERIGKTVSQLCLCVCVGEKGVGQLSVLK